ncbi:MAG: transcriptional regulator, partial [Clostridia bacterium]|nr:transcriptional regulator [Clostridia bacterium]
LWACYTHACVKFVQGEFLTNSSLRERFGVDDSSSASISRLIKEACEKGYIKKLEDTAPKHTKYMPSWG